VEWCPAGDVGGSVSVEKEGHVERGLRPAGGDVFFEENGLDFFIFKKQMVERTVYVEDEKVFSAAAELEKAVDAHHHKIAVGEKEDGKGSRVCFSDLNGCFKKASDRRLGVGNFKKGSYISGAPEV